jgi:hypothetical protein
MTILPALWNLMFTKLCSDLVHNFLPSIALTHFSSLRFHSLVTASLNFFKEMLASQKASKSSLDLEAGAPIVWPNLEAEPPS